MKINGFRIIRGFSIAIGLLLLTGSMSQLWAQQLLEAVVVPGVPVIISPEASGGELVGTLGFDTKLNLMLVFHSA